MSSSDENALVERVFLRIGSAESDEQLEKELTRFLPPVILKLDSTEEGIRKKVMELLVHVNKRLKSRTKIQLPIDDLLNQYLDPKSSSIVTNFSIIYIKMGFPRLPTEQQVELIPKLISCLDGHSASHQDNLLQLIIPVLDQVKFPQSMEQRREKFKFVENEKITKLLLEYMLDLLIVPYGSHVKALEMKAQPRRPATAPPSDPASLTAPPGLSVSSFRRVMGDEPYNPETLEKVKLGIVKFLGSDLFPEDDVICHYIMGAADTRHSVATAADMELKRILGSVDMNKASILNKLFTIFLGTVQLQGQTSLKPEQKRVPACTRIRLKIFPYFLKARESANSFPFNIQVIFGCLYGESTNIKLKVYAVQFIHHMCLSCTDDKFYPISPLIQQKLIQLLREGKEDPKVLSLSYVAMGKLVNRFPQLVKTNVTLVQIFFHVMSQVDAEMRLAVQEALSLMANAFRDLYNAEGNESYRITMEALLMEMIDKEEPQARMMAVQYADRVFTADNIPSRYILLLACGDSKEDIRIEALKGLKPTAKSPHVIIKESEVKDDATLMPKFAGITLYIKEKADFRINTNYKYVSGATSLPFNPVAYSEILYYLRQCLAFSTGLTPDMENHAAMKEQAPQISKYVQKLLTENKTEQGPIQTYLGLVKQLLKTVGGPEAMYCLLEIVAMAPEQLVPQFLDQLNWLKTFVFAVKDDIRELGANLYAIVVCNQSDDGRVLEALDGFHTGLSDKLIETQHGSMLALGFMIGLLLRKRRSQEVSQNTTSWQKIEKRIEVAVLAIARLVKVSDENNPLLAAGACQAVGEIGRNCALPLPDGEQGASDGEITKLTVVENLLAIIKSGKENTKSKERASMSLGHLCVGEEKFPHRKVAIEGLMDSIQMKQVELHFTIGEALVCAAQGPTSPTARDLWNQTEEEFKLQVTNQADEVDWYTSTVLQKYVCNANPHVRQGSSIWLLALVKRCGKHEALQKRLGELQGAFMKLLSESDELTQDISSKGLGMVYEFCTQEQKDMLVSDLVDTLMTGKRKQQEVTGDTQVFEEGSMGKTPDGGGLTTYKELCSIANELNQPDLIYKFMHLANHNAMWNSRKGAAFGFSTIAAQAGEQLAPYLPKIVPRLYRYQFDPNPKIQQAMTSIWNSLVQDNKNTVDRYMKEILGDLLMNLTNSQWRVRESSCLAVNDLLRGRPLDDVVERLPELWETCLRVLDDIKESVRKAADLACKTLSRASIKICDVSYGKIGEQATSLVLPCLLKCGLQSSVSEVRAIGLSTILKISKQAGVLLKPHIPVLVAALLEAVSGLEPQVMNYLSLQNTSNQEIQNRLDSARIAASKMSPMMETVNLCVQYVDESVLPELIPRLCELIKGGIGVATKAGCSNFVISLVHQCPNDLSPHAGKLMAAFLHGLADRNSAIRKSNALALGHLVKIAKDSSVEKLIIKMRSWYLEKEEEVAHQGCGLTLHAISQQSSDVLRKHASVAMPLAFLAMHEKQTEESEDGDKLSLWEEVWLEVTPGTEAGIRLYLTEIVDLLEETLQSQSWSTKAQAASAMSTVGSKMGLNLGQPHLGRLVTALLNGVQGRTWEGKAASAMSTVGSKMVLNLGPPHLGRLVTALLNGVQGRTWEGKAASAMSTVGSKMVLNLGPPHLGRLVTALLNGIQGRTWEGKESLIQALQTVCTSCGDNLKKDADKDYISMIVEALLRESKKEKIGYKLEALKCFGNILETFSLDRFADIFNIVSPVLDKGDEKMEVDGEEKDEISSDLQEKQLICYFTVLGQAWPDVLSTQDEHFEKTSCVLCESLQTNTWRVQESILKTTHKYITRLKRLKELPLYAERETSLCSVVEKHIKSLSPCLSNLKYTVIRRGSLNVVEDILSALSSLDKISSISEETLKKLRTDLKALTRDSNPDIQDKSTKLLQQVVACLPEPPPKQQ